MRKKEISLFNKNQWKTSLKIKQICKTISVTFFQQIGSSWEFLVRVFPGDVLICKSDACSLSPKYNIPTVALFWGSVMNNNFSRHLLKNVECGGCGELACVIISLFVLLAFFKRTFDLAQGLTYGAHSKDRTSVVSDLSRKAC